MRTVLFSNPKELSRITVLGREVFLDRSTFETLKRFRGERIADRRWYNTGPSIIDEFAMAGSTLVEGGEITLLELLIVMPRDQRPDVIELFGADYLTRDKSVPNPNW